jgi:REP element-mobilizing transposase RayT
MDFPERIFFITTVTAHRKLFFSSERAARMFLDSLLSYRDRGLFQIYEFVVMPDHLHLILAPKSTLSLERGMQFIKGGFSHRFMKETALPNLHARGGFLHEAVNVVAHDDEFVDPEDPTSPIGE